VLKAAGARARTEVRRIYEYLMAGIGLLAGAAGLVMVLAALVEVATRTGSVGGDTTNSLLAAATLLAVGGPVWWLYWHGIQRTAQSAPADELTSRTRRIYLSVLFGMGSVAAVIALIVGVYLLFRDAVDGTVGAETFRSMRFPIGVLSATAAIAAYHWEVYRADHRRVPAATHAHGPKLVLLVGPPDGDIARAVARRTHGRVQTWSRTDEGLTPWTVEEVMTALDDTTAEEVMVLSDATGLHAIPVHRG
jgi:F0F1-type ATP synthase membrane subunit c/vacuolar-type H+-ATPase subunit K